MLRIWFISSYIELEELLMSHITQNHKFPGQISCRPNTAETNFILMNDVIASENITEFFL